MRNFAQKKGQVLYLFRFFPYGYEGEGKIGERGERAKYMIYIYKVSKMRIYIPLFVLLRLSSPHGTEVGTEVGYRG